LGPIGRPTAAAVHDSLRSELGKTAVKTPRVEALWGKLGVNPPLELQLSFLLTSSASPPHIVLIALVDADRARGSTRGDKALKMPLSRR
jgi:hypothetical protein